jgi:hypothetical protein
MTKLPDGDIPRPYFEVSTADVRLTRQAWHSYSYILMEPSKLARQDYYSMYGVGSLDS